MESAAGRAPGKVILLGEHSVVFGEPAIAAALDRGLEVAVRRVPGGAERSSDERLERAIAAAAVRFELERGGLEVRIASELPVATGLGSSAALSLSLVRALAAMRGRALAPEDERAIASEIENVFHGTASGVDVATSASAGVIWFQRGTPPRVEPVAAAAPFEIVVALSGVARSTSGPVGGLRARRDERPELFDPLLRVAGDVARQGRRAIEAGDWASLGALMNVAQGVLNAFGVSTPALEAMVATARGAGALGAKLTGAGGGGAIVALAPGRAEHVREALADAGWESFVARVAA